MYLLAIFMKEQVQKFNNLRSNQSIPMKQVSMSSILRHKNDEIEIWRVTGSIQIDGKKPSPLQLQTLDPVTPKSATTTVHQST